MGIAEDKLLKYKININIKIIIHVIKMNFIALIMEAASTSEESADFCQTTLRNNPGDSHLHVRREKSRNVACSLKSTRHVKG
jgi:hypothetical protein